MTLPSRRPLVAPAAICAIVLFVVLNMILWQCASEDKVKGSAKDSLADLWNGAGSIDLTVQGFQELTRRPTVVLLGSSLIMHPFWSMDAESNKHIDDIFHHHRSITLEKELASLGCPSERTYSFAVFGEMASDAYIYVEEYLKGAKKPDVLVFGVAPRDFGDSFLTAPMATFTFKKVVGLNNFGRYSNTFLPGWQDKADFVAAHVCYFYGKRWRLQHEIEKGLAKIGGVLGQTSFQPVSALSAGGQAGWMMTGLTKERWEASEKEYRQRYRGIGDKDLSLQFTFLEKLLAVCRERGIKVILINMPLTEINRALLPNDFYSGFRKHLANVANQFPNTQLIDLGESKAFIHEDYWDTAHLGNLGGHKLLRYTLPALERLLQEEANNR